MGTPHRAGPEKEAPGSAGEQQEGQEITDKNLYSGVVGSC